MKPKRAKLIINIVKLIIATTISSLTVFYWQSHNNKTNAQTLVKVGRNAAINSAIDIEVFPGRDSIINFSQAGEVITHISLADPSQVVFHTNSPISGGQATAVFLRPIQELTFPGATRAYITNITITTEDKNNVQRLYSFNIVHKNDWSESNLGVTITPREPGTEPSINIGSGRMATLSDIERGLEIAIESGYTSSEDPVVIKIKEFLAKAWNGVPVEVAINDSNINLAVLVELGKIAREENSPREFIEATITELREEMERYRRLNRGSIFREEPLEEIILPSGRIITRPQLR